MSLQQVRSLDRETRLTAGLNNFSRSRAYNRYWGSHWDLGGFSYSVALVFCDLLAISFQRLRMFQESVRLYYA